MSSVSRVSELTVGSLLIYPKGSSPESSAARAFIRYQIKQGRRGSIEYSARRLREILPGSVLEGFFAGDETLVPVPGHAPRFQGGLWVAERICRALVAEGIGREVATLLDRVEVVPRSSILTTATGRPGPEQHCRTLSVGELLGKPARILLVDDVVTRGSTLIGCTMRMREAFPSIDIRAFALARVEGTDLESRSTMLSPKVEAIHYDETTAFLERS